MMDVKLVLVGGEQAGKAIPIRTAEFVIGRGEDCHLRPQSKAVSRRHCAILVEEGAVAIKDFGSTNGTFVNGQRIEQEQRLNHGDRIHVHKWEFELQLTAGPEDKTNPKLPDVQEAAVRTVASAAAGESNLDVDTWVEEDNARQNPAARAKKPTADQDTVTGKSLTNTAAIPAPTKQNGAQAKGKTSPKPPDTLRNDAKPPAESASTAVDDMLRRFFTTKR